MRIAGSYHYPTMESVIYGKPERQSLSSLARTGQVGHTTPNFPFGQAGCCLFEQNRCFVRRLFSRRSTLLGAGVDLLRGALRRLSLGLPKSGQGSWIELSSTKLLACGSV